MIRHSTWAELLDQHDEFISVSPAGHQSEPPSPRGPNRPMVPSNIADASETGVSRIDRNDSQSASANIEASSASAETADHPKNLPLKYVWVLWFHNHDTVDWSVQSYRRIFAFSNVEDFWRMAHGMPDLGSAPGMYFIMKDGIMPLYEDPRNIGGSLFSYRVFKKKLEEIWTDVMLGVIGNTLIEDDDSLCGISVNTKNSVIKLWLSKRTFCGFPISR